MKLWLRPVPFALLAGYALTWCDSHAAVVARTASPSDVLCTTLQTSQIHCSATDVVWLDGPRGILGATVGHARAIVRARVSADDAFDLFVVEARLSPEGRVLRVLDAHNLTRTTDADEGVPVVYNGSFLAYVVDVDGRTEAVHVLDLRGRDRRDQDDFTRLQRAQISFADWQEKGQARGVRRTVYALTRPVSHVSLSFRDDGLLDVHADASSFTIDASSESVVDGANLVRVIPESVAKPPTFAPWMSERLRAASWFGDDKNQLLKVVAFTAREWFENTRAKITGDTGQHAAEDDLGALNQGERPIDGGAAAPTFVDPVLAWPPEPLTSYLKPQMPGEGQWVALDKDAFITPIPGLGAPFLTTFVRGDPTAPQTRVYITLWDPRLIALHMEAGTVEPVSATGEAGPGQIPRTPETMRHVVAGFNGGFQATHGQFGMQANGVLYLPPKPYAATVLEMRDGSTAFGAWPPSPTPSAPGASPTPSAPGASPSDRDAKDANNADVPADVLSFRQNMSPLVQADRYNPWGRAWWGGVPPGWHDAIHTTRSGLCLTKENFVAYFWGNDIGPEPLGRAMLAARCTIGMQLDMNPGRAGVEFYNVQPTSSFQPLGRPLQADWEYEGTLKDLPTFRFRSRRMVKSMGHMLFPRYIHRDARDFFYLTTRSVLPGAPLPSNAVPPSPPPQWQLKGLPQHGFPYAVALASMPLEGSAPPASVHVLRIDPRTVRSAKLDATTTDASADIVVEFALPVRPAPAASASHPVRKPSPETREDETRYLWFTSNVFLIDKTVPEGQSSLAELVSAGGTASSLARAAVGISDEDGMLQWVELGNDDTPNETTANAMLKLLERIGCSTRGLVRGDVRAFLGGTLDTGGQPRAHLDPITRLVRDAAPGARAMFESTPIVPQSVWYPLQERRVKWRPTLAPPEKPAPPASASASSAPQTPPPH
jgi:hypothetical protein